MKKKTSLTCARKPSKITSEPDTQAQSTRLVHTRDATALLKEMYQRMQEGPVVMEEEHPLVGRTYDRLGSAALREFLDDAQVMHEDARFISFSLLVGTHGRKRKPFMCMKNRLEDGLHLLIGGDE